MLVVPAALNMANSPLVDSVTPVLLPLTAWLELGFSWEMVGRLAASAGYIVMKDRSAVAPIDAMLTSIAVAVDGIVQSPLVPNTSKTMVSPGPIGVVRGPTA